MTPRRIHIIGGPGSGKTRLAIQLAQMTHLPLHHLDEIARVGGGGGPVRPLPERERLLAEIVAGDEWITEGVHLGWTAPSFERADVIVWLDHISWLTASRRISRRFAEGGLRGVRPSTARPATRRAPAARLRDYGRHARDLGGAIFSAHRYYAGAATRRAGTASATPAIDPDDTLGSRAATEAQLAPYTAKVVRCRTTNDVAAFLERMAG